MNTKERAFKVVVGDPFARSIGVYCLPKKDYPPEIDFLNSLEITLTRRYPKLIFRINCRRNYPEMPLPNAWALTRITRNWLCKLIKDYPYLGLPGISFLN